MLIIGVHFSAGRSVLRGTHGDADIVGRKIASILRRECDSLRSSSLFPCCQSVVLNS